jgi:ABC-2 type transport system permease protein
MHSCALSAWTERRKHWIGYNHDAEGRGEACALPDTPDRLRGMNHASAILWAQWRTVRNFYPRGGAMWGAIIGTIWYGFWLLVSIAGARLIANPENAGIVRVALPGALLIVFIYWQVVPVLMAATGASLELRKLKVYPIPVSQLFGIEVMLRVTAGIEMILVLVGIAAGVALNPQLPAWAVLAIVPYILFNLLLAAGVRDLLVRLLARRRIREIVIFLMVMLSTVPRLMLMRNPSSGGRIARLFAGDSHFGWPWTATANWLQGVEFSGAASVLFLWTLGAAAFGRWQFSRTLAFDAEAAASGDTRMGLRQKLLQRIYRFPSWLLSDPLGALVEKEIRFLARSPRFRLVFLMGFTFGVVVMLPMSLGRGGRSVLGDHYLTMVSVYSLLLLSESCFWNSFGFDRSAAQIYFLAPVPFSRVLIGKNLSALFFIGLEISAITAVCAVLGMPLKLHNLAEAYSVAGVVTIFLLCAGNLMSIYQARAANPSTQFRANAAGRVQAMLLVVYPVGFVPAGLAYLARFAFHAHPDLAFFGVLAFDAAAGMVIYKIALDSAVLAAERRKEEMIAALSAGDGPIAG